MGLFDRFKKAKPEAKPEPQPPDEVAKPLTVAETVHTGNIPDIVVKPLLSEKGMSFAGQGRYVFLVNRNAQKPEIRKAIQKIYNVHVTDVKIINLPAKKRRSGGRFATHTSPRKKAVVILKKGEKISGIAEAVG